MQEEIEENNIFSKERGAKKGNNKLEMPKQIDLFAFSENAKSNNDLGDFQLIDFNGTNKNGLLMDMSKDKVNLFSFDNQPISQVFTQNVPLATSGGNSLEKDLLNIYDNPEKPKDAFTNILAGVYNPQILKSEILIKVLTIHMEGIK